MKVSTIFYAMLFFSLVVTTFSWTYVTTGKDLLDAGVPITGLNTSMFSEPYNKIDELSTSASELSEKIQSEEAGGTSSDDSETKLIGRIWSAVISIPNIFTHAFSLVTTLVGSQMFGLPPFVGQAVIALIVFMVAFAIISIVFKWEL